MPRPSLSGGAVCRNICSSMSDLFAATSVLIVVTEALGTESRYGP
jgi:hypothetical protein